MTHNNEYVPAEALREALAIIDRLFDQQAMPDDFHVKSVARLRALIDGTGVEVGEL